MVPEERSIVKTTVPKHQKDLWVEHADELDMSQAEFVRSMVQAGRRGFDLEPPEPPSSAATPGVDGLKSRVLEILESNGGAKFDEIVKSVTDDIEAEVDEILQSLYENGRVSFSNVDGYSLNGVGDGDD